MNNLKHFTLTVLVALVSSLTAKAYDFQYNGLYYKITTPWNSSQRTCEVTYGPSGKGTFSDVSDYTLENVVIPEGVAYNGARYLVTAVGQYAFTNCKSIKSLKVEGTKLTSINDYAFYNCNSLTSVTLNENVKTIKDHAFCNDSKIVSFSMPGIENLETYALAYCHGIKTLTLPATLKEFPAEAIGGMQGFEQIIVAQSNPYYCSEDGILFNKEKTAILKFPEAKQVDEYNVPEGITEIGMLCFNWTKMKKIKLPDTVKKIEDVAFRGCYYLTDLDLGHSVEEIGDRVFWGCNVINQIVIPNSVKSIGEDCFMEMPELKTVVFGENLQKFKNKVFSDVYGTFHVDSIIYLMKSTPNVSSSIGIPSSAHVYARKNIAGSYSSYLMGKSSVLRLDSFYSNEKPGKGKWYESGNDFTGLYCIGDTLFAFSGNYKQTKPSDMKNYASKSDYKYNPNAEFYNHNYCVAFDFSKSGVKASDFVGKKISGTELIGTPVSNIDECGLTCITIYTTPQLKYAREGDDYNMNTYRVINFAYPADDGNGYPYYLVKPVIGERCKVTGTYNSSKGGFYDSSLDYTVKIRGIKDLVNYRTYTLEGIIRYITTKSSYSGGEYVLDVTGDISFDYKISKQPTEDDLSVELNKQNSQATYQWYQIGEVPAGEETINFNNNYWDWTLSGYGIWKSKTSSTSNTDRTITATLEVEEGDTLSLKASIYLGGSLTVSVDGTSIYGSSGVYTKIFNTAGTATLRVNYNCGYYYDYNDESRRGYATISDAVIKRSGMKEKGVELAGATASILSEEQFIDGKSVYCVVTLPYGQKLVSDTIQTKEYFIAKQPTARDLSVELSMPTNKAIYQWYNGADESVIPNATNYILKELDGMNVGDIVFCEVTLPNGRLLRSDRVTLNDYSLGSSRTITYIVDGNVYMTEQYEIGSPITAPEPPVIEGYTFVRWENLPNVMSVNNLTVTAIYKENKCVIYNGNNKTVNSRYIALDAKPSVADAANALIFVDEPIVDYVGENFVMKGVDKNWRANSVALADAQPFYNPVDVEAQTVNYVRNFTSTNLQALYLPYAMSYDDWKDKAKVSYINDVHQFDDDDDGEIDRTVLEFISVKSGELAPNIPYLIKPLEKGETTFTSSNKTLKATLSDGYIDCSSTRMLYTLKGTYQTRDDIYANGYYAMSGGTFKVADNAGVKLSPFRIFLSITNRYGSGAVPRAKKITIMVDGVEEETTDIDEIMMGEAQPTEIYNLHGVKVDEGYKGIVIKNGRKVLVK